MTTTAPGQALRVAAAQLARGAVWADPFGQWNADQAEAAGAQKQLMVDRLNDLADELDAAPATYSLPPEPPETVTELWDQEAYRWYRIALMDGRTGWRFDGVGISRIKPWWKLLVESGPLFTVPPERTEAQ